MIDSLLKSGIRYLVLTAIQVLLLQNIQLGGYINPFLYILTILWLPLDLDKSFVMIAAFFIGLTIDVFTNTLGLHASACVAMAFVRPWILQAISPRDGYEAGTKPNADYFGWPWLISYAALMTFVHHTALFFIEAFRFSEFFHTFFRVFASGIFTLLLIVITQFFTSHRK